MLNTKNQQCGQIKLILFKRFKENLSIFIGLDNLSNIQNMINIELSNDLSKSQQHTHEAPNIFGDVNILCPQGNSGYAYCLQCENCSVVCKNQEDCPCYSSHKNCQNIKRISMFNGNLQNQTRSPKILNTITKLSQQMIDNISQLQESIKQNFLLFGLNQADVEIIHKIRKYAKEKSPLVSNDLRKYKQQYQKQEKIWFQKENQKFQNLLQKCKKFLCDQLSKIRQIIYYEHMENSKDPIQVVFQNSSTLKGDLKFKNRLLQMLKELGKLSKAEKVFTIKQNNFTLDSFYENCSNRKQLLYLVKNSTDRIYGAYSPVRIQGNAGNIYDDLKKETFIFDLQQNLKSRIQKTEKVMRIYSSDDKENTNRNKILMQIGDPLYPNFILAQDSMSIERLNYIWFGSKDFVNVYFEKKPSIMYDNSSKINYTVKQFEVFELTFN